MAEQRFRKTKTGVRFLSPAPSFPRPYHGSNSQDPHRQELSNKPLRPDKGAVHLIGTPSVNREQPPQRAIGYFFLRPHLGICSPSGSRSSRTAPPSYPSLGSSRLRIAEFIAAAFLLRDPRAHPCCCGLPHPAPHHRVSAYTSSDPSHNAREGRLSEERACRSFVAPSNSSSAEAGARNDPLMTNTGVFVAVYKP